MPFMAVRHVAASKMLSSLLAAGAVVASSEVTRDCGLTAVERSFAWLTAHRRLARDYERDPAMSEAMIRWAAINTMTRRLARGGPATR